MNKKAAKVVILLVAVGLVACVGQPRDERWSQPPALPTLPLVIRVFSVNTGAMLYDSEVNVTDAEQTLSSALESNDHVVVIAKGGDDASTRLPAELPAASRAPVEREPRVSIEGLGVLKPTPTGTPATIPQPAATPVPANPDINGDGAVNIFDLVIVGNSYGCPDASPPPSAECDQRADVNSDGVVNIFDQAIVGSALEAPEPIAPTRPEPARPASSGMQE